MTATRFDNFEPSNKRESIDGDAALSPVPRERSAALTAAISAGLTSKSLNRWERGFLQSLLKQKRYSARQVGVLVRIMKKIQEEKLSEILGDWLVGGLE